MGTMVMPPIDEYKKCPHCDKKLGMKLAGERRKRRLVVCPWCEKEILPDMRVF